MSPDWLFNEFELNRHGRKLLRDGVPVPLGARAFDVLCVLAERAGAIVSKSELFDRVWPQMVVEENNLQVHVSTLRKLLGSAAITTLPGQGYCFTPTVLERGAPPAAAPHPTREAALPALKRSVAVLPFTNLSGDSEQEYFSDGIAEDVIAQLTRSRWLFVTSRNSSFNYRGEAVASKRVALELGVRYVVYGSVRRAGPMLRITAELVDGTTGDTLWANRYDRSPTDLFAVQDEISSAITSAIEPVYLRNEEQLAKRRDPAELQHWDLLMRARWHFWRSSKDHVEKAKLHLEAALQTHPDDSAALALLAFVHLTRVWANWSPDPRAELQLAHSLAQQAVRNDEHDAYALLTLGTTLSVMGENGRAIDTLKAALEVYPQFSAAAGELGRVYAFMGQWDEAHEFAVQATDASPQDPHVSLWLRTRAIAEFVRGDSQAAVQFAKAAVAKRGDWFFNHYLLAACLSDAGQVTEAEEAMRVAKNSSRYPEKALRFGHPFHNPADYERFVFALQQAGWQG